MNEPRDHRVYLNYDEFGEVLYVGCTKNLKRRHIEHRTNRADWLPYMVRTTLKGPYTYKTARRIEWDLINQLDPWFNETSAVLSQRQKGMASDRRAIKRLLQENPNATSSDIYALELAHIPNQHDMRRAYENFRAERTGAAA